MASNRPPPQPAIGLQGDLQMMVGTASLGGTAQVALLEAIAAAGSISQGAKAAGISYKSAWDTVDAMNQLAGEPLLERVTGGKGGGGTRLTGRGERLVRNFRQIEAEHQRFVSTLEAAADGLTPDYLLLRKLAMKTSVRNQFAGTVTRVSPGAVNDEVVLAIGEGLSIVATVTHDSVRHLGLAVGSEALALIKATSVVLATGLGGARVSARNVLVGSVARIHTGAVNSEVTLDVGAGRTLAAIVTNASVEQMGLAEGQAASAFFKAGSVILAVPL